MIKEKLKELGIKLVDFANLLEISRPTLDTYIEQYENGIKISKDKYNYIFDNLFKNNFDSKEEFLECLENYHDLIERDKALGTFELPAESTDLMISIVDAMKEDMNLEGYNEKVYSFINMVIRDYRKQEVFTKISEYFLILNGHYEYKEGDEEQKKFLSNFYKFMHEYTQNKLEFKEEYYYKFLKRTDEIRKNVLTKEEELKEEIMSKINKEIKMKLDSGISIEDINIDDIFIKLINQ